MSESSRCTHHLSILCVARTDSTDCDLASEVTSHH